MCLKAGGRLDNARASTSNRKPWCSLAERAPSISYMEGARLILHSAPRRGRLTSSTRAPRACQKAPKARGRTGRYGTVSTGTLLSAEPAQPEQARPLPVRPGWTLPVAVAGAVAIGVGWWQYHGLETQRMACDVLGAVSALTDSHPSTSCSAVRSRQLLGIILMVVGGLGLVVGSLAASRRGLKAARQGSPWPLRRAYTRMAHAVDSRLPGYSENRPRISRAWVAGAAFVALVAAVAGIANAWDAHQRSVRQHRYAAGMQALHTLALPVGVTRVRSALGCPTAADTICARSDKSPDALAASISTLLHGEPDSALCQAIGIPSDFVPCPVAIYGTIAGNRAVAVLSEHLITVKSGKPPAGARLVSSRMKHLYVKGSDITIGIASPLN
jgi:hypothetical protein